MANAIGIPTYPSTERYFDYPDQIENGKCHDSNRPKRLNLKQLMQCLGE
ncbi:MAG: hypothetical protein ACLTDX_12265 [[Clostridium] innocuum]